MSDSKKPTHRYIAYRDGEQVMEILDDGTLGAESMAQLMRNTGHLVIRQRIPEIVSA